MFPLYPKRQRETKASFPFLSILALIFITLKLTGHIDWSWWWVLLPLWLPFGIILGGLFIYAIFYFIVAFFIDGKISKRK